MLRKVDSGAEQQVGQREKGSKYANIDAQIPDHDSGTPAARQVVIPVRNNALPKGYWTRVLPLIIMGSIQDA